MKQFFEYVFYRSYMYYSNKKSDPKGLAIILTAAAICCNFLSVFTIIDRVCQLNIMPVVFTGDKGFERFVTWPITLAPFWIASHRYMHKNNKYLDIIKRYNNETATEIRKGKIKVVVYLVLSLTVLVLLSGPKPTMKP